MDDTNFKEELDQMLRMVKGITDMHDDGVCTRCIRDYLSFGRGVCKEGNCTNHDVYADPSRITHDRYKKK